MAGRISFHLPSHPRLLQFASGLLMGLVLGLTILMAAALLPGIFGYYPLVVQSGSMEPALNVGDIAVTRKTEPYTLRIGDVVTYSSLSGFITHRVVGLDVTPRGPFFLMKGDANRTADPQVVSAERVVGRVVYRVPRLGFLVSFTDSAAGRFLFIGLPILALGFAWLRRYLKPSEAGKADVSPSTE